MAAAYYLAKNGHIATIYEKNASIGGRAANEITDFENQPMYAGQIIQYKISPFLGLKLSWVIEVFDCRCVKVNHIFNKEDSKLLRF